MPNAGSGWGTHQPYIPVIPADQRAKLPGVPILFADQAELEAAVTAERANIDIAPVWMQGQQLRVATEGAAVRVWTLGVDAASSHARLVQLPSGATLTLGADTSQVRLTTGAPSAGLGANGDVALDASAMVAYAKTTGAWAVAWQAPPPQLKTINGESLVGSGDISLSTQSADTQAPAMVGSVSVSAVTHNSATLAWSAGTDNTGVVRYEYSTDGGNTYTSAALALTVNLSGLLASTTYPVRVRAVDAAGNTSVPLSIPLVTSAAPDTTAPTLVGTITFTSVTQTSATLAFPAGTDNTAVAGYRYSLNGGVNFTDTAGARSVDVTGLSAGISYPVQVVAYDAAGNTSTPITGTLVTQAAVAQNGLQTHVAGLALKQWSTITAPNRGNINGTDCTASISGDVMTVTQVGAECLAAGQWVVMINTLNPPVTQDTRIIEQLTGTPRGVGTYRVSKSQSVASRAVRIQAKMPRERFFFDGNALWPTDGGVNANLGSFGGGVGTDIMTGFSAIRVNAATGQVLFRGGGHGNGNDGSIFGFDFRDGPGRTWKVEVPGAKVRSAAELPPAWWNVLVEPATLKRKTASGTSGTNQLTITDWVDGEIVASSFGSYVWAEAGGIPVGTAVQSISGNVLTLTKNLTESFTGRTVRWVLSAYWTSPNVNGHTVPTALQHYSCNAFIPGTDTMVLGGAFVAGGDYTGNIGAGWAYSPSYATNGGMAGPFQVAASLPERHPELARYGYNLRGAAAGPGVIVPCDADGKLYVLGTTHDNNQFAGLWRWDNPSTSPAVTFIGNGGYNINPPSSYSTPDAVCIVDPRFAGGAKRAIVHDQRMYYDPPRLAIWSDITGTPQLYWSEWTQPDATWNSNGTGPAPSYCWNSDKGVVAVTDGIDIWEFSVTFNGTAYVIGTPVKLTQGATGTVPAQRAPSSGGAMVSLHYYAPAKCYLHGQDFTLRVIRSE